MDVNCGTYATFATTADGHVYAFGLNNYGQLALPSACWGWGWGWAGAGLHDSRSSLRVARVTAVLPAAPLLTAACVLRPRCPARPAGQAPVYAPKLVKALEGKGAVLVRSGQHHTLVLTHAGGRGGRWAGGCQDCGQCVASVAVRGVG